MRPMQNFLFQPNNFVIQQAFFVAINNDVGDVLCTKKASIPFLKIICYQYHW